MINTKSLDFEYKPFAHSRSGNLRDQKLSDKVEFRLDFYIWCSINHLKLPYQLETIILRSVYDYDNNDWF